MKQLKHSHNLNDEILEGPRVLDFKRVMKDLIAGSFGGIASTLSGHPLDTVRVRVQVLNEKPMVIIKNIVRKEGLKALYKGVNSPLMTSPIITAIMFGTFESCKRVQGFQTADDMTFKQIFMAGAMTGVVFAIGITPIDLIKCRLQMEGAGKRVNPTGTFQMARNVITAEGYKGLFRGLGATLLRDIPACAVQLGSYEVYKKTFKEMKMDHSLASFLSGGLCTFSCWIVSYPMDVVKTKLQVKLGERGGIRDMAKKVWKTQGAMGFWRGITPTLARSLIAGSFNFLAFESAKKFLE
jgi:solute carrier family 25 carnitine/acylcarnitine transporter 20/29